MYLIISISVFAFIHVFDFDWDAPTASFRDAPVRLVFDWLVQFLASVACSSGLGTPHKCTQSGPDKFVGASCNC